MKKTIKTLVTLFIGATFMLACTEAPLTETDNAATKTRTSSQVTPVTAVYIETNDTNPLNAGAYYRGPATDNVPMIDIVELFAANIHDTIIGGQRRPTLYLNNKLTRVLEPDASGDFGYQDYVVPLQQKGIKVVLTVLGDWRGLGLANMDSTQTTQFADILNRVVNLYNLDGIGFDDEYANYPTPPTPPQPNNTSFSEIILKLRALMGPDKLITVFDWGYTNTISQAACNTINYAYTGPVDTGTWNGTPGFWPNYWLNNARWSPVAYQLGQSYSPAMLSAVQTRAGQVAAGGYGAMMCFNLRRSGQVNPQPVLNRLAVGAYGSTTTVSGNANQLQTWPFIPGGLTFF